MSHIIISYNSVPCHATSYHIAEYNVISHPGYKTRGKQDVETRLEQTTKWRALTSPPQDLLHNGRPSINRTVLPNRGNRGGGGDKKNEGIIRGSRRVPAANIFGQLRHSL